MVDKEGSRLTTITAAIRAAAVEQRGAFSARSAAKRATLRAETTGRGSDLVRMDVVRWDAGTRARFARMIECARYNLNGSADNAFAEALALAHLHRHGDVVPERDLLRCAGFGAQASSLSPVSGFATLTRRSSLWCSHERSTNPTELHD